MLVIADVTTVVAIAVHLSSLRRHDEHSPPGQDVRVAAVAMATVWATSGLVAAALRAQLVRRDLSLVGEDEEFLGQFVFDVSDYVVTFGLVAMAIAAALVALATGGVGRIGDEVITGTATVAALAAALAGVGSAFPSVRDGRVGDTSIWRPGGGTSVLFFVGWMALVVGLAAAGWRDDASRDRPTET